MSELDTSYVWKGREDQEDGDQGLRWHQVINKNKGKSGTALIGLACDLGVKANKGRVGAKNGPDKIRDAMANLAWHGNSPIFDSGNVVADNNLQQSQAEYANQVSSALSGHSLVIGLGGGHEIAWGSFQGLYANLKSTQNQKIGIINFDAHFDLRKPSPLASSGTPFWQIAEHCQENNSTFDYACIGVAETANTPALFSYAKQLNVKYILDRDCDTEPTKELLTPFLQEIDSLYVTICLDAFPAHVAPGVSAPASLGIFPSFVIDVIHWLAKSQNGLKYDWRLADIAEMNPVFDQDDRTAKLAARLVFEISKAHDNYSENVATPSRKYLSST
jgi:formiminoglutamase